MSDRKIKVAHVITLLEWGGAQQNTLFTVEHLDRSRFDVLLVCGEGGILDAAAREIPDAKVRFAKNLVRPVHPLKDFLAVGELARIFKEEKPDIVHTHSSKAGILGRIAARRAGVPCILHSIHGFGFNPYQNFLTRKIFVGLEGWTAGFTQKLIAVSRRNIEQGLALGIGRRDQYELIRSGVDLEQIRREAAGADPARLRRELDIPPEAKAVLTVGPFKPQKDPLAFVRLAGRVARKVPEAVFLMVGEGELRPDIERLIRELKLEGRVRLLGWRRDVPALMRLCDVFVLTSLWEGLPRVGVEALVAGRPVLGFAVDGIPEIVREGENGFVFQPGRLDEMAEKTALILQDEKLARSLGEAAARTIDRSFDIREMVREQERLYAALLPGAAVTVEVPSAAIDKLVRS